MPTYVCYDRKGIHGVGNTPREALRKCRLPAAEGERMIAEVTDRAAERLKQVLAEKRGFYPWDGAFIGRGARGDLLDLVEPCELELLDWYWRAPMGLRWAQVPEVEEGEELTLSESFAIRRSERRRRRSR